MKPIYIKPNIYIDLKVTKMAQNLKLVTMLEYRNIKTFLGKAMLQISLKNSLWLKKS